MRNIITFEDNPEYLRQVSSKIDFNNDNLDEIINDLKEYCTYNKVYALSPVQIGIPKTIMYIKNSNQDMSLNSLETEGEGIILINPKIVNAYGETYFLEACQSTHYKDGTTIVSSPKRPYKIEIEYYDTLGNKLNKVIEGFESTIFCHEFDHFYGVIHSDRVSDYFKMPFSDLNEKRKEEPYKIISTDSIFPLDDYLKFDNNY